MKKLSTLFLLFIITHAYAQKKTKEPNFDIMGFNQKAETAEWLCEYDAVAWWTSDSVMAYEAELERLGSEWFCYQDADKLWHALYGKMENERFEQVFHFALDSNYRVARSYKPVDTALANGYARALSLANAKMLPLRKSAGLGFNPYIRRNEDQTYTVWYFPAFQKNNTAVYGGEYTYTVDAQAKHIIKEEKIELENFRGFKVDNPREISLDYSQLDAPSLGGIFFVWYYKKYFTRITLETGKSNSTVFKHENGPYYWVHVDKTGMKKEKKPKK